jgi:nitroreductase
MNYKNLIEVIKSRRSIRKFNNDPVSDSDIEKMIEAACWAPSGSNQQNWRFIAIKSDEGKNQLLKAITDKISEFSNKIQSETAKKEFVAYSNYYTFFVKAPVVIAVVKKPYDSLATRIIDRYKLVDNYKSNADIQGPAAAIQNMLLTAASIDLGTCWMTGPLIAKNEMEAVLGIKKPDELCALIPLGKPESIPQPPKRKQVSEVLEYK